MALTALAFKDQLESVKAIGGVVGTLIPAFFLLAVAAANS
jgi:high-affinity nickel permease